ncbi:MAG: C_GCAxxG_C_C family protein [Treponema sp.]|nr:C_GCAxxG_C_C family protein [Treponema sp.]
MTTIEQKAEQAAELKRKGLCNCCQAVVKVFAEELPCDEQTLLAASSGYAAGMGCMESTCGALIGAVMVAGLKNGGKAVPPKARALFSKFKEDCGATICGDLKGIKTGKVLCECDQCVKNAVLALGQI